MGKLNKSIGDIPSVVNPKPQTVKELKNTINELEKKIENFEIMCKKENDEKYLIMRKFEKLKQEWEHEKLLLIESNKKLIDVIDNLYSKIDSINKVEG